LWRAGGSLHDWQTARPADVEGAHPKACRSHMEAVEALAVSSEDGSVAGEQGVGECNEDIFAVTSGRKPCGGLGIAVIHQLDQAVFSQTHARTAPKRCWQLRCLRSRWTASRRLFAMARTGAEAGEYGFTDGWRSWRRALGINSAGESVEHGFLKRGVSSRS